MCGIVGLVLGLVLSAYLQLSSAAFPVVATRTDGCTALPISDCSYVARRPGRIVAVGSPWVVIIERGERRIVIDDTKPAPGEGVIRPSDRVTASCRYAWSEVSVSSATLPRSTGCVHVGSDEVTP